MIQQMVFSEQDIDYLRLLSHRYPTIESAGCEIINLQAILNLPKGTEHFVSDIHGEYDAFRHVVKNASGVIKSLIDLVFGDNLRENDKKALATLIYYPERKLAIVEKNEPELEDWYRVTMGRLIKICKAAGRKYTRSKVRKALPAGHAYIIEELLHENEHTQDKQRYYDNIINSIIELDQSNLFITELAYLIQRLAIDRLHIIGDIYDRGKGAAKIMDLLCRYHSVDIQWGNHDISWMGAAAGCPALVCNVIRIQARYNNLETLEDAYGINLVPLAAFALEQYKHDPCTPFLPPTDTGDVNEQEIALIAKIHKAIAVIQFKCEAAIIRRHPEFRMENRIFLDKLCPDGTVEIDGRHYPLLDTHFPTVEPADPLALTPAEQDVLEKLTRSFTKNEKLQEHIRFLFTNGSLYHICDSNLLFHGCIPLEADGSLKQVDFRGQRLSGRAYLDAIERTVREGYFSKQDAAEKEQCLDWTWYMWCGADSPLCGKDKITTFERYFVDDEALCREERNAYYPLRDSVEVCDRILADFGLPPEHSHIINGHVPVQVVKGEQPIKANGKLFVIDGGFAKAYQKVTGIAGYTLIYNSHGLVLVSHEPFESVEAAVQEEKDILSSTAASQYSPNRILVADTDNGRKLQKSIDDLKKLVYAYKKGILKESR